MSSQQPQDDQQQQSPILYTTTITTTTSTSTQPQQPQQPQQQNDQQQGQQQPVQQQSSQSPPAQIPSQDVIDAFWEVNLSSAQSSVRPSSILPVDISAKHRHVDQSLQGIGVDESYNLAVKDCIAKVAAIVKECQRVQVKYSDPHFNLDDQDYCLKTLADFWKPQEPTDAKTDSPACAKRVGAIFGNPQFFINGSPKVQDTRQGAEGDCWFLSAVNSICSKEETHHLVQRLCPSDARDTNVGVYGFVFCRDGEWISEVVDDKLYLKNPDYDDCLDGDQNRASVDVHQSEPFAIDETTRRNKYRELYQTGSDALFYGACVDQNETWLPLLEKAFAKAHGAYSAIDGGEEGEGVEDLTGGITTNIDPQDILDVDNLWNNELLKVNAGVEFLFGMGSKEWQHKGDGSDGSRQGIEDGHAYAVLRAEEYKGNKLLMIKNPWGRAEWNGAWSDDSTEWKTYPDALTDLKYSTSDDGIFWMPYEDFLRRFSDIQRTRLFTPSWKVSTRWTTMRAPWAIEDNATSFRFKVPKATRAVIVLSQLDSRYFVGLEGQYVTSLSFSLHARGEDVHFVRGYPSGSRSATTELDLPAGEYDVFVRLSTQKDPSQHKIEDVVALNWLFNKEKLMQIGLSYDLAQAKGKLEPENGTAGVSGQTKITEPTPTVSSSSSSSLEQTPADKTADANAGSNTAVSVGDVQDANGPWDASIVLGLRVFCESSSAEISVVNSRDETAVASAKGKHGLDVDDPEKDLAGQHVASKTS